MSVFEFRTHELATSTFWLGRFAQGASALDQPLEVILPAFSDDLRFGPCLWPPRLAPIRPDLLAAIIAAGNITPAESSTPALATAIVNALNWHQLPKRGDNCIVGFDENDKPFVLIWWPKT